MRKEVEILRKNVFNFIITKILNDKIISPVLEIGPMDERFTPIKKYFYDTKKFFIKNNIQYISYDIYPESNCDIIDDILNLKNHFSESSIGSIIALEVLEHTSEIWLLPDIFWSLLKPKGKIYITCPYHFYRHSPFPDYWRISEDGLKLLFSKRFDIIIEAVYETDIDGNVIDDRCPIDYSLIGIKK